MMFYSFNLGISDHFTKTVQKVIPQNILPLRLKDEFWTEEFSNHINYTEFIEIKFDPFDFSKRYKDYFDFNHNESQWVGMSGSFVPIPQPNYEGYYFHTTRIVFTNCDKPRDTDGYIRDPCFFTPKLSVIYADILNSTFQKQTYFNYLGFDYPRIIDIYSPSRTVTAGPEDARVFIDSWNNINLIFNMEDIDGQRLMWTFNITSSSLRKLNMLNHRGGLQKNWIPLFKDKTEYFLPSLANPRHLYICPGAQGKCKATLEKEEFFDVGTIRGGSPFYNYKGYYISLSRFRVQRQEICFFAFYRPQLVILSPTFKLIYISEGIDFNDKLFVSPFTIFNNTNFVPICEKTVITSLSFYPIIGKNGSWAAEISVNDQKSFIVIFQDTQRFLDYVIKKHKKNGSGPRLYPVAVNKATGYVDRLLERFPTSPSPSPSHQNAKFFHENFPFQRFDPFGLSAQFNSWVNQN